MKLLFYPTKLADWKRVQMAVEDKTKLYVQYVIYSVFFFYLEVQHKHLQALEMLFKVSIQFHFLCEC